MHLVVSAENMSPFPRGGRVFGSVPEVANWYKFLIFLLKQKDTFIEVTMRCISSKHSYVYMYLICGFPKAVSISFL
jgi:hypothetical protein